MLEDYRPKEVLRFFEEICAIPHGSGNTKAISDYLVSFAKERHLDYVQDEANNVVIRKKASPGHENARSVILQGHMDMVCEKEDDVVFDFEKDPLRLRVEGDELWACGTTLGGDDGIALAYAMAALDDDELIHGPLTAVFTVDEEVGMEGAKALDKSLLSGEAYLMNIDSEKEGEILTFCAGGARIEGSHYLARIKREGWLYDITISGLSGGHSGEKIGEGGANAIMLVFDLLAEMKEQLAFDIVSVNGGGKDNAIPRSAKARILCNASEEAVDNFIDAYRSKIAGIFSSTDPGLSIEVDPVGRRFASVIADKSAILEYFTRVPNGVQEMSPAFPGLVHTSLNAGILKTEDDLMTVTHLLRSADDLKRDTLVTMVCECMKSCDFEAEVSSEYPAWKYRESSRLRDVIQEVTADLGLDYTFNGIHAGLETGLFYECNPSLDIVSFGPDVHDIHTPREHLDLSSAERCYRFLLALITRLAEPV